MLANVSSDPLLSTHPLPHLDHFAAGPLQSGLLARTTNLLDHPNKVDPEKEA